MTYDSQYKTSIDTITKLYDDFKHIPKELLYSIPSNFRIVKMLNGRNTNWYLLRKSKFLGLFTNWKICTSYDQGRLYGCEEITCSNPVYLIIESIPDILRAYIGNRQIFNPRPIPYPRYGIQEEIDIKKELTISAIDTSKSLFDNINQRINK